MSAIVRPSAPVSQPMVVDQSSGGRSTVVDLEEFLAIVRGVVTERDWSLDALKAEMDGKDRSYINKVLNGDKPMSVAFLLELPTDVQAEVATRWARAHGRIVVEQVTREIAIGHLVSGLMGVLAGALLPQKADRMVKVERAEETKRRTA